MIENLLDKDEEELKQDQPKEPIQDNQEQQNDEFAMYADDIQDQLRAFKQNKNRLMELYPTFKINQLLNFKNDVDDLVGFELDELVFFLRNIYNLKHTKRIIKCEELYNKILPQYAELATRMREEGRDNYYLGFSESDNEDDLHLVKNKHGEYELVQTADFLGQDAEPLEEERSKIKGKSQEIFQMKVDKHFDKIKEIFEQNCVKPKKKQEEEQKVQIEEMPKMKLSKLKRLLDDLAYVNGFVFIFFERYLTHGIVDSRTQKVVIKKLKHELWLQVHNQKLKKDLNRSFIAKSANSRRSSVFTSHSKAISQTKQLQSILKTIETNFDTKINENPDEERQTKVKFEDELYKYEKNETKVTFDMFLTTLEHYFENNPKLLCLDATHEFDSYFQQQLEYEKNQQDENYDPFVIQLQEQINKYEGMLGVKSEKEEYPNLNSIPSVYQFKTSQEREIINKLYEHAKQQMHEYLKQKQELQNYQNLKNNNSETLDQIRQRAIKQIFYFYTGQHWKWNLSFDELLEKKSLLDFGEFNIFCKDFKVPLPKSKIQRVFKKCSINHRPHEQAQFAQAIEKLGIEVNSYKIEQMEKRLDEINKIEKLRRERQIKKLEKIKKKEDEKIREELFKKANEGESEEQADLNNETNQIQEPKQINQEQHNQQEVQPEEPVKIVSENQEKKTKSREPTANLDTLSIKSQLSNRTQNRLIFQDQLKGLQDTLYQNEESQFQEPLHIEKQKLIYEVERLKKKTEQELIQEFYEFLEFHDLTKYRKKLRGLKVNPFDMRDNYQRIAAGEIRNRELQNAAKQVTAEEIRAKVKAMREKRLREKRIRELREKKKEEDTRVQQAKIYENNRRKRAAEEAIKVQQREALKNGPNAASQEVPQIGSEQTYMKIRNKQMGLPPEEGKNLKLTLEDLERMNYQDILENKPDDFHPRYILEEEAKQKKKKKKNPEPQYRSNNTLEEVRQMIVGGGPNNDQDQSFDNRNYSERIYNIKKERKEQASNKKLTIDLQPKIQNQQMIQAPMTERSGQKRGVNQPLQKEKQIRSLKRGMTPDLNKSQNRSKSKHKLNKSLNKSSISHGSQKSRSKSHKRKQSAKSIHKSVDLAHLKGLNRNQSVKTMQSLVLPGKSGSKKQLLALPYPQSVKGSNKGTMSVSHSTANLKSQNIKMPAGALVPYNMKQIPMTNKYTAQEAIMKAQNIDKKQQIKANINMANILKMHEKQIEKGLQSARR